MLAMLEAEGVDLWPNGGLRRSGQRCSAWSSPIAGQHVYLGIKDDIGLWPFPEDWHALFGSARALYTDGYTLRDILAPDDIFAAFATARAAGVPIFFDPGPSVEFIPPDPSNARSPPWMCCCWPSRKPLLLCGHASRVRAMARALLALGPPRSC